jgi:hypothetical protein
MSTIIRTKATVEQTVALAKFLANKGLSSEETLSWLKSQNYTVRNVTFQGVQVSYCVAGYNLAKSEVVAPPVRKPRAPKKTQA